MEYLEIVLQGYFNENNKAFLEKYFLREYKKAEKEQFIEADEFQSGCLKIIKNWENDLQKKVLERKKELSLMLQSAKSNNLLYNGLSTETDERQKQETILYCEKELADVRPNGVGSLSFTLNLYEYTNKRFTGVLTFEDILQIKQAIIKAFEPKTMNEIKRPYNGMYVISKVVEFTRNNDPHERIYTRPTEKPHQYELQNQNIYSSATGEMVEEASQIIYNTAFLLKLKRLYVLDVHPFLTHQLTHSKKPKELYQYIKYSAVNSDIVTSPATKAAIQDWLTENSIKIENPQLVKALPPQPISVNESRTKKLIFETINNIDKQGWQYAFVSEQDYNLFTDLLTNFFEYQPYTLPETTIQLKRTCKTKVAKALGEIHKELSNENKLITDTKYFQLIRVLSHFEKENKGDLYKALTR